MRTTERRSGRPTTAGVEGEKSTLSIRASAKLKGRLTKAAEASGRSLSAEAEFRLEHSFREQEAVEGALKLAYGPELAALLLLIGHRIRTLSIVENFITGSEHQDTRAWLDNPYIFDQAARSISKIVSAMRPAGDPDYSAQPGISPDFADMPKEHAENIWRHATENDLFCVAFSHPKGHPELRDGNKFFKAIREALGENVVQRVADAIEPQQ